MFDKCSYRHWQLSVPFCYESSEGQVTVPQGAEAIRECTEQWEGLKMPVTCITMKGTMGRWEVGRSSRDPNSKLSTVGP